MNRIIEKLLIPKNALFFGMAVVAASTVALPGVSGYGTQLLQVVVLGAWTIVAAFTSGAFADQHHGFLWPVAMLLNVALYSVPAIVVIWFFRNQAPKLRVLLLGAWLVFYLACLFVLFPATDGP